MSSELFCPNCGAPGVIRKGGTSTYCKQCNTYPNIKKVQEYSEKVEIDLTDELTVVSSPNSKIVTGRVPAAVMSHEALLLHFGFNPDDWRVEESKISRIAIHRKDRKVDWVAVDGRGTGTAKDTGKLLVEYVYNCTIKVRPKKEEKAAKEIVEGILRRFEADTPRIALKKYPKSKEGMLLQVMIPDIHIGRRTSVIDSGENYDLALAEKVVMASITSMLSKVEREKIEKVLFLFGNDAFNVDNAQGSTAAGTPQQEQTDYVTSFLAGEWILSRVVDTLTEVAPLDLHFLPGNHDPSRVFYLGRVAQAKYAKNKNVKVTNDVRTRQYYKYGWNLLGFTHGDRIKHSKLPAIMPLEIATLHPDWWASTRYREWHCGHFHTKQDMEYMAYDDIGVTLRFFRSLTSADRWHFNSGFVGSPKAAESILWTKDDGIYGQYPATIRKEIYL